MVKNVNVKEVAVVGQKLNKLLKEWNEMKKDKHQREGQALMNALSKIDIDAYNAITATEVDCFYNDDRIPEMLSVYKVIRKGE